MGRVSGKVAIVTGAARGMGAEIARLLAEEGARVMLTDILDGHDAAAALGNSAHFMHHDVADEKGWQEVVRATEEKFGPVSILVNNAGINCPGPIETFDQNDYRRVIDVNQVSVFLGMKTVIPSMKRGGGGSIVNISSVCGMFGVANTIAYTSSKFAIRGMTKCAAIELAPFKIRVNSVHPGLIETPMSKPLPGSSVRPDSWIAATPLRRIGEAEEVAHIVLMLASDESSYTTGSEFLVDGGLTAGKTN